MAPPRARGHQSAARPPPPRWGCHGCPGSGARAAAESGSPRLAARGVRPPRCAAPMCGAARTGFNAGYRVGVFVVPVLGALYCLQSATAEATATPPISLRQSVFAFHFFLKSLTNVLSADCCPVAASCALTDACACVSDCWLPGVVLLTSKM